MTENEQYHRQEWMSDEQWECALMLSELHGGFHHLTQDIKKCGKGIAYNSRLNYATFDNGYLTSLVLMAHERAVRVDIGPSGPGMIKLTFHKRKFIQDTTGQCWEYHPIIEDVLAKRNK